MHSYIYHSGTHPRRNNKIHADFDFSSYLVTTLESESSIHIADIRSLLVSLSVSARNRRLVYLPHAESLTPAAQSALLKTLEEPPSTTTFVLATSSLSALLPTIRSRCVLVAVDSPSPGVSGDALAILKTALTLSAGGRVTLADTLGRDRKEIVEWLDTLVNSLHTKIQTSSSSRQLSFLAHCASLATNTRTALAGNVATGLAVRNFFLGLPHTSTPVRMEG